MCSFFPQGTVAPAAPCAAVPQNCTQHAGRKFNSATWRKGRGSQRRRDGPQSPVDAGRRCTTSSPRAFEVAFPAWPSRAATTETQRENFTFFIFFWPRHLLSPLHAPLLFQTATLASVRNLRCPLVGTPVSRQTCIPLSPGDARRPLEPVSCCPAGPTANPGVLRKTHGERRKAASPWDHTAPHSPCTYVCGGHQSHRCSSARYGEQGTGPRSPNWAGVTLGPESRRHPPSLSERSRTQLLGRKLPSFCYFLISH